MPKVFTKNCKIKVIEYSDSAYQPLFNWQDIANDIRCFVKNIVKI